MSEKFEKKRYQIWVSEETKRRVASFGDAGDSMEGAMKKVLDIAEEKRG
jgi:hypothetical protein